MIRSFQANYSYDRNTLLNFAVWRLTLNVGFRLNSDAFCVKTRKLRKASSVLRAGIDHQAVHLIGL